VSATVRPRGDPLTEGLVGRWGHFFASDIYSDITVVSDRISGIRRIPYKLYPYSISDVISGIRIGIRVIYPDNPFYHHIAEKTPSVCRSVEKYPYHFHR
jgi:hypothetical protein